MKRILPWLAISASMLLAFWIKLPSVDQGAPNLEATYHILLTDMALMESPISAHHLLSTVTLGGAHDRFISFGATLPIASGHYVYTSFPVTSFLAPLGYFELTGQPPSRAALFQFSILLQIAVVIALAVLVRKWLRLLGIAERPARAATAAGVAVQILSTEALLAYGPIYWAQSFYQLILIGSLICLLEVLRSDAMIRRGWLAGLCALAFLGTWTEWTGLVFAAGAFLVLWWRGRRVPRFRTAALLVGASAALALLGMVAHYAVYCDLEQLVRAYGGRAKTRSALFGSGFALLQGYGWSFGLYLLLAAAATGIAWRNRPATVEESHHAAALVLVAAGFPMLENLVLSEHATEFSFDRLKLAIPLAMLIAYGAASIRSRRLRVIATAVLALAIAQNVLTFRAELEANRGWAGIDRGNRAIAAAASRLVEPTCALIASASIVRGYDSVLFHRNIREGVTPAAFRALTRTDQARRCGAIYLDAEQAYTGLARYHRALVWRDGRVSEITPLSMQPSPPAS